MARRVCVAAEWGEAQLGVGEPGMGGVTNERPVGPNWTVVSALAAVVLYIGLRVAGWGPAAQWVLAALVVAGSLLVALQMLVELDDGVDVVPALQVGFSDDPDELAAQLAQLRPAAALRVSTELPVYSQCCRSLGFNPMAGAGVR